VLDESGKVGPTKLKSNTQTANLLGVIGWAAVVSLVGGFGCGLAIDRYGRLGSITLWALGALAGFVGHKINRTPSRLVGWLLVVACASALVIAEVWWIRWNIKQSADSWWTAVTLIPAFVQQFELAAIIAAIFTAMGAWSAYRSTTVRYRLVAIERE